MSENKEFNPQAVIEILENGPVKVTGNIILSDYKRDIMDTSEEIYLCRCGKSKNKPYCDESHKHD
jgi:CDGSH-type Zn-finger protein